MTVMNQWRRNRWLDCRVTAAGTHSRHLDNEVVLATALDGLRAGGARMPTRGFLVLFDYGQGGLWAVIRAQSAEKVRERYPELEVFESPPKGLSTEVLAGIRGQGEIGIDDPPVGWLADLVAHRLPVPRR